MLKEFKDFISRGSVLDLAAAVIFGVAIGKVITSLVDGIIMPPIGMMLGKVDFANLFYNLSGQPVASLADAKLKGLPVIAYGAFINDVLNFIIIAFVIFMLVRTVNKFKKPVAVDTKDCPSCLSTIPLKATRCANCCVELAA